MVNRGPPGKRPPPQPHPLPPLDLPARPH